MPKLTRENFLLGVEDLWRLAQKNLAKDKYVHGMVIGLDSMSRWTTMMISDADHAPSLAKRDVVPIVGTWIENLDLIRSEFASRKIVAAMHVSEAWVTSGQYAVDTVRMDIMPSEHPMKDEIVFVMGCWPREFAWVWHRALIERDARGENPRPVGHETITDMTLDTVGSWLYEALPQPR